MNALSNQSQSSISLDQFLALSDFEPAAKQVLPHPVYEYIASGAGNEITLIDNERAYDRIRIWPRVLNDVRSVDTSVSLLVKCCLHQFYWRRRHIRERCIRRVS